MFSGRRRRDGCLILRQDAWAGAVVVGVVFLRHNGPAGSGFDSPVAL